MQNRFVRVHDCEDQSYNGEHEHTYHTYELEYALKQSEIQTLLFRDKFQPLITSEYSTKICPEAYEANPRRISSDKFPF